MQANVPPEIAAVLGQLVAADREAQALVVGLSEELGTRRPSVESWSVAECLDHLATANRVYLSAMIAPAQRARAEGRFRRRPALPGIPGRLFVYTLEPPPRWWSKLRAPRKIRPRAAAQLGDAYTSFLKSQVQVRDFFTRNADLDLATIRFRNPFVRGIRFSLATGLHVMAAHDRRHLLQGWRVRRELSSTDQPRSPNG